MMYMPHKFVLIYSHIYLIPYRQVDHMLKVFEEMNVEMERTGSFRPAARKEELLQMVAKNNLLFTDIISKLGIMERFDVAWKNNDCNDVYEHLRGDLEIENRNSNLQIKVSGYTDAFVQAINRNSSYAPAERVLKVCSELDGLAC